MALVSRRFSGVPALEACAVEDSAHLLRGSAGPHVALVQQALIDLGESIESGASGVYEGDTEGAVVSYKTARQILNFAGQIDPIVGKKTIAALDAEIEKFDAAQEPAGTRLRFASHEEVETRLGFEDVVERVATALREDRPFTLDLSGVEVGPLDARELMAIERI